MSRSDRERGAAAGVEIGTLRLRVPARDAAAGRRIAEGVAQRMAASVERLGGASITGVRIAVDATTATSPDAIARAIDAGIFARRRGGTR